MPAKSCGDFRRAVPPADHRRKLLAFEVASFLWLRDFHGVIFGPVRGGRHWEIYGCHPELCPKTEEKVGCKHRGRLLGFVYAYPRTTYPMRAKPNVAGLRGRGEPTRGGAFLDRSQLQAVDGKQQAQGQVRGRRYTNACSRPAMKMSVNGSRWRPAHLRFDCIGEAQVQRVSLHTLSGGAAGSLIARTDDQPAPCAKTRPQMRPTRPCCLRKRCKRPVGRQACALTGGRSRLRSQSYRTAQEAVLIPRATMSGLPRRLLDQLRQRRHRENLVLKRVRDQVVWALRFR